MVNPEHTHTLHRCVGKGEANAPPWCFGKAELQEGLEEADAIS